MANIADDLREWGWVLRSGGAPGADKVFESHAGTQKEIFTSKSDIPDGAFGIAEEVHPAWDMCNEHARRLHARNVMQILGQNLDAPVRCVICWTPDGCEDHCSRTMATGGTGQAISVASLLNIPVYNLENKNRQGRGLAELLEQVRNVT
jgi:hypothetical protein